MTDLLEWIVKERGKPKAISTDNGPEFTSSVFTNWCHKHRIEIRYIQPGNLFRMLLLKGSTEAIEQRFWMQESTII